MARRRLNTKVFAFIMGALVLMGTTVFLWARFRSGHGDARALEARGDELFARADYKPASDAYLQAVGLEPKNAALRVKLGDTYVKRTREGRENLDKAYEQWREAVNNDPRYKPALEKLILSEFEQIELMGAGERPDYVAQLFNDIRTRAEQLLAIEPNNPQAIAWRHLATVRQWLLAKSVQSEDLNRSMAALRELSTRDPANADAPYYLAETKIEMGKDALNGKEKAQAAVAFGEAAAIINEAIAAGQQKNAMLQFRAHQVYQKLATVDPKAEERKHQERAGECIAAAAANVNDKVKDYDKILLRWANWQLSLNKPDEARKIRQKLYDDHPNNQNARIAWADTLKFDPKERPKAIEILTKEIPLSPDVVGAGALLHRELQAKTLNDLILIHLQDYSQETDPAKRAKSLASAEEGLDRLKRLVPMQRHPLILGFEARLLLIKDRAVEAVQVMEEAYRQFRPGSKDYVLMFLLAQTYAERTGQPGSARKLCEEIVNDNATGWLAARALLTRLLVAENKIDQARVHVETIRRQNKDYFELPRLEAEIVYGSVGIDPKKIVELLDRLPERDPKDPDNVQKTLQLLAIKYEIATRAEKPEIQIDLLNKMIALDPKNNRYVGQLVQIYKSRDWGDRAMAVVDRALAANPDDPTLKLLKMELSGTPAAELREEIRKQIQANTKDPFQVQLKLYELERTPGGSWETGVTALTAAEKLRPDDRVVLDLLYKEYLSHGRIEDAKIRLDKLVRMNADNVGGRLYRHRFAKEKGDFAEAERIGVELVDQYPQFALSWFALGQAQMGLGKYKEAITSFTEVLARQPNNYEACRALVDAFYYDGQTDKAEGKLREMYTGVFAQDPTVFELIHMHWANFGKPELAIPGRKDRLAKYPKDPRNYLALAATYFKNAQKLALERGPDEAKKQIDLAFDTLSKGREQFPDDTRFYAQVAEIHLYNGKLDQGEQVLRAYADAELAKPPPAKIRPDPWLALAEFYMRSSQPEKAVNAMNEALVRSNNDLEIRLRLVSVMVQARQFADAVRTLDVVRNEPDPRIRRQRLEILIAQGSLGDAERQIRAELAASNDGPELRNLLASVLIDTGRSEDAIVELNRALTLDRSNEAARYLRALAYAKRPASSLTVSQQNQQAAINELIELDKTQRNQVQTRLLLAELYEKTGRRKLGIQKLEEVLKKNKGSREVRLALVRMYRSERPPNFAQAHALVDEAEKDPVLKTDPVWHREAAMLFQDQRQDLRAIDKMREALRLAPGNSDYRRQYVDMLIRFNQFNSALIETDRLLHDGIDNWWLRSQRGVATGRQLTPALLADAKTVPAAAARVKEIQTQSLVEFDQSLKMVGDDSEKIMLILRKMGETVGYDPALERVTPRLANDPNNDWKILSLAMKRAKGDFKSAIADGERMLADPANGKDKPARRVPILRALADVYQNQSPPDFARARDRYIELLSYDRDDLVSLNNLAYILAELVEPPDPQAAKVYSRRAFDLTLTQNEPDPASCSRGC
jgi:tetratricopeptide (TPR) repeat protein